MTLNQALISETTLNTSAASVTIAVPSGYTDLRLVISGRTTRNNSDPGSDVGITFNGSSTGYYTKSLNGDGSSVGSGSSSNASAIGGALVNSSYATANTFGTIEAYIPEYSSSNKKSVSIETVTETNATTAFMRLIAAHWDNTAAITSITLTETNGFAFVAGSSFTLYGISKLGVTPTQTPKATGGDIIKNDGTYWYHAFLSTGAFIPQTTLSCDYLVVAGGGAGGGSWGGGGGAGGYRAGSALALTGNTLYAVAVGAGAAGANSNGANGGNSSISTITSAGGGGGGYYFDAGRAGGSGGGGAGGYGGTANHGIGGAGNTPSTSPSQGNNGGEGYSPSDYSSNRYGGGGGGSAAVGASATSGSGGAGGAGTSNSITGTAVTYAAGGNGNALGGGAGAAGTGNGGAGGGESVAGSNGGSGIVIVRYAMA